MKKLKFFLLLDTLEEGEVIAFHKYLKRVHRGEDTAIKIFEYIRKLFPKPLDKQKLDMEYAYRKIFRERITEKERNRKKMLNSLSDLYLWLKDFLLTQKVCSNSLESQALWLQILHKRGLKEEFARQAAGFYTQVGTPPEKGTKMYMRDMAAGYFQFQHLFSVRPSPPISALQECLDVLNLNAEIIKLKMTCEMNTAKKVRPLELDPEAMAVFLVAREKRMAKSRLLLRIYKGIDALILTEQEDDFNAVEHLLFEQAENLDPDELHGILSYLHNFAAAQIRAGKEHIYAPKLHRLNQFGLKHSFFTLKGEMSPTQFTNIVNAACTVKDFDWAKLFVEDQLQLVSDKLRDKTRSLSLATIYFEQANYREVLKCLEAKDYQEIHYIIRSRLLILRSYFELQEDVEKNLDYCIAFEAQLLRFRKPKTGAVEATLEFVRVCKMILQEKADKTILLTRITENANLYLRNWLLKQVTHYKGRSAPPKRRK